MFDPPLPRPRISNLRTPSDEDLTPVMRFYDAGFSLAEVARLAERPKGTVHTWIMKYGWRWGVEFREPHVVQNPDRIPSEEFDIVRRLYEERKLSQCDIALLMGFKSSTSVKTRLRLAGVPVRSRSEVNSLSIQQRKAAGTYRVPKGLKRAA